MKILADNLTPNSIVRRLWNRQKSGMLYVVQVKTLKKWHTAFGDCVSFGDAYAQADDVVGPYEDWRIVETKRYPAK